MKHEVRLMDRSLRAAEHKSLSKRRTDLVANDDY